MKEHMSTVSTGFNVIGPVTSTIGLATATRGTLDLLINASLPLSMTNLQVGERTPLPKRFADIEQPFSTSMPYGVNVFHMQPDTIALLLTAGLRRSPADRRINSVVPFWEVSHIPKSWVRPLETVDAVLAPSLHIAHVLSHAGIDAPIIHYPQGITVPANVAPARGAWDFADNEIVFLSMFDVLSDIIRKNPLGALDAFQLAFPKRSDVRLVIRMKSADADLKYALAVAELRARVIQDSRVSLVEQDLSSEDIFRLIASADVFVSMHRAEGLGLILMESMALGTPVIGTGWSGNLDYMTDENSALVGFDFVDVNGIHDYYQEAFVGGTPQWAEPRTAEAANWMRRFADDHELASNMGQKARRDMANLNASVERLTPFLQLAEMFESGALDQPRHSAARRRIRSYQRAGIKGAALRRIRNSARSVVRALRHKNGTD